ncbi:MAG: type II toxin-antitoxin system YoeB family toxin [Flavobacteriaceae bacterium]|nr:type II toxin-antitoxin system YoeB family toxin [Flavobacteriaceae bacterium]
MPLFAPWLTELVFLSLPYDKDIIKIIVNQLNNRYTRRITSEHRLVYKYESEQLLIAACRYHYGK